MPVKKGRSEISMSNILSLLIYFLTLLNCVVITVFYSKLSRLDDIEMLSRDYIAFSLGVDYLFCVFLSVVSAYIYREAPLKTKFGSKNIFASSVDFMLPMAVLIGLLVLVIRSWP